MERSDAVLVKLWVDRWWWGHARCPELSKKSTCAVQLIYWQRWKQRALKIASVLWCYSRGSTCLTGFVHRDDQMLNMESINTQESKQHFRIITTIWEKQESTWLQSPIYLSLQLLTHYFFLPFSASSLQLCVTSSALRLLIFCDQCFRINITE